MASPSAGASDDEQAQPTHHEQLYAMAELAQVCHFCGTFQAPLKLPVFSRTDLQAALIAGTQGDDRQVALLAEVHFKLVREQGAKIERMIQDWEKAVTRKVTDNWRLEFSSNPLDGVAYDDLTVAQRIQILNALCHWKLESCAEIQKFLAALQKDSDPKALEALRATPIGYDDAGSTYWYFGDCCWIYAEDRPAWQSHVIHEYAVEFADAKRIRLSINFDPKRSLLDAGLDSSTPTEPLVEPATNGSELGAGEPSTPSKMQILSLVHEEIDEDEEDEPLPVKNLQPVDESSESKSTERTDVDSERRKMDISMLCDSPSAKAASLKPEPMEEDEHDVSEDRFMSTIISTRDKEPTITVEKVKEEDKVKSEPSPLETDHLVDVKKRRLSEENGVVIKNEVKPDEADPVAPPKRRKTRFHDIVRVSDYVTPPMTEQTDFSKPPLQVEVETSQSPLAQPTKTTDPTGDKTPEVLGAENCEVEDFDIICEACQRSYDRRYLDPPLEKRPVGEWRCFECLVNDARGWPRRRNPTSRSPKGTSAEATEEDEHRKSGSSSKRSKSKSSKSSSKKSSSSRSSSSKKSSSSSKKSSKKHKKSSSSSSKHHSSSSRHHHSRHREEYAKLLKLAHSRKRERRAIEQERLNGAHLCPVSIDGPTGWRVVCCSVDGLRQVIEKLTGGSLEQDRLRGRLISILKVEEKMEQERMKKREQQLWQILPRRQSSRVAMGRIKTHTNSGDSDEDSDEEHGGSRRSSRVRSTENGVDSRQRLALDRESRAKRRRAGDDSESESDSDGESQNPARSINGWINWALVKGDESLTVVCSGLINRLLKEEIAELFARPVDPDGDGCPDYLTVIEHPMDLGTIRERVDSGFYTGWEKFKSDVNLVWTNCRKYNSPDTAVVEYANTLDELFKQMRKEAEKHGVRKMGITDVDKGEDVEDHDVSEDESVGKSKSESSASEVSSDESDDSSDASSGDDEDGAGRGSRNKRVSRPVRSASRPSRSSRSSSSTAPPAKGGSSRRKAKHSDSEDEADSDSESEEEEDMDDSDDSDVNRRSRGKRSLPRRGSRSDVHRQETSSRPSRSTVSPPPPSPAAKKAAEKPRRNRIESSDSSSSEASVKGDDSSSSDDSEVDEKIPLPKKSGTGGGNPEPEGAPPPPSPPPPPPPPSAPADSTTPTRSSRKQKTPSSKAPDADLSDSSSSYFSSSDSDSSAGGSDSSDSD